MPDKFITPGVYIQDKNAFPASPVAVETALPVFIGYTEKAIQHDKSLVGIPVKISSLSEYKTLFGQGFKHIFSLQYEGGLKKHLTAFHPDLLSSPDQFFYFYNCIRLFYKNGGGNCYIMSLGTYGGDAPVIPRVNPDDFSETLFKKLETEPAPSIVVLPDIIAAFEKDSIKCCEVYDRLLQHCNNMQSRFAILDVYCSNDVQNDIAIFRQCINSNHLKYGAAYYPWLHTSVVPGTEIDFNNLSLTINELADILPGDEVKKIFSSWQTSIAANAAITDKTTRDAGARILNTELHQSWMAICPVYKQIMEEIGRRLNRLPPAAAMAGIYSMTDNSRGVWKAPANIALTAVDGTSVNISQEEQESMNVDVTGGKSINALKPFPGTGVLVWGARTLDGNSQDWRYINVRRTMIMIEQSLKLACRAYVFEPNDAATWVTIRSMMENFLYNLWKQGALAGTKPSEAYDVQTGTGSTITQDDLLNGRLVVCVKLAIVRPAEFIVITFSQLQQGS